MGATSGWSSRARAKASSAVSGTEISKPMSDPSDAAHAVQLYRVRKDYGSTVGVSDLSLNIERSHVHNTLNAQVSAGGGSGHSVLPCSGFGNHPLLAHSLRK